MQIVKRTIVFWNIRGLIGNLGTTLSVALQAVHLTERYKLEISNKECDWRPDWPDTFIANKYNALSAMQEITS